MHVGSAAGTRKSYSNVESTEVCYILAWMCLLFYNEAFHGYYSQSLRAIGASQCSIISTPHFISCQSPTGALHAHTTLHRCTASDQECFLLHCKGESMGP